MKYLIVECHPGYAVAVDEAGSFLKIANRRYRVGQYVTDVIVMQPPKATSSKKWVYPLAAVAACLVLLFTFLIPLSPRPYASVYVKINPEVRIDVDKNDRVVGLEGVNQDGSDLIAGYDYHRKSLDLVTDELVDLAIAAGYLQADGQITVRLESGDRTWVENHHHAMESHLNHHMAGKFAVSILVEAYDELEDLPVLEEILDDDHHDRDRYDDDWDDDDDCDDDDDDWDDDDDDHHRNHH